MSRPSDLFVFAASILSSLVGFATMVAVAPGNGAVVLGTAIATFVVVLSATEFFAGYRT